MKEILHLSKLKSESFQALRAGIEALKSQVQQAHTSHTAEVSTKSLYDTATAWQNIARSDAFSKGKSAGYADACNDMLAALEDLAKSVDSQQKVIQEIISDLEEDAAADATILQDETDPLD